MPSENTKPPEGGVCAFLGIPAETDTRDYSKQLEFHEYELSQAEQRGFPDGQIAYHVGKVTVLKALMA